MTYEQASKASKCDPAKVNEALEGLMLECPECEGRCSVAIPNTHQWHPCDKCNGKGKIPYTYTPQVGEWCFINKIKEPQLIVKTDAEGLNPIQTNGGFGFTYPPKIWLNTITPILDWKTIEEVLEKAGYELKWREKKYSPDGFGVSICRTGGITFMNPFSVAKSRQEAVMLAVGELRKEMK